MAFTSKKTHQDILGADIKQTTFLPWTFTRGCGSWVILSPFQATSNMGKLEKSPMFFFCRFILKKRNRWTKKPNDFYSNPKKQAEQLDWFLDFDDWNPTEKKTIIYLYKYSFYRFIALLGLQPGCFSCRFRQNNRPVVHHPFVEVIYILRTTKPLQVG